MTQAPQPAGSRIVLRIDRVVLRGFTPADRTALVDALQTELTRSFADPQACVHLRQQQQPLPVLRLGRMPFVPGPAGGTSLGRRIAAGIASPGSRQGGRP